MMVFMKEKRGPGLNGIKSLIVHGAHRTDYYFCCLSPRGLCMLLMHTGPGCLLTYSYALRQAYRVTFVCVCVHM